MINAQFAVYSVIIDHSVSVVFELRDSDSVHLRFKLFSGASPFQVIHFLEFELEICITC